MMKKPEIGQRLYSLNIGNAARDTEQKLTPVVVKKVGRKYFTAGQEDKKWTDVQYYINGWSEKTEYSANSALYENPKEWENAKRHTELTNKIFNLRSYDREVKRLPLSALETIWRIIEANQ